MNDFTFDYRSKYISCPEARLIPGQYMDGSLALQIVGDCGAGYEENISTATVCLVDYSQEPEPDHVFVKVTPECEGVLQSLQKAGVVGEPVRWIAAGYVARYAAECPVLLPELLECCSD